MTDDRARVLSVLREGLDAGTAVRVAWAEAPAACPAAVLLPAKCVPVCVSAGETLLTEITQAVRLTARSYAQLQRLAAQAEAAMQALGYTLADMDPADGLPRSAVIVFKGTTDGVSMWPQSGADGI